MRPGMLLATEPRNRSNGTRTPDDQKGPSMRLVYSTLAALALLLGIAGTAAAKPDNRPCDATAMAEAQVALASVCPCDTAENHGQYVSCVAHWAVQAVRDGNLPRTCRRPLRRATVRSTCGKPNFITCCREGFAGTRCVIRTESLCLRLGGTVGATNTCATACMAGSPSGAFVQ